MQDLLLQQVAAVSSGLLLQQVAAVSNAPPARQELLLPRVSMMVFHHKCIPLQIHNLPVCSIDNDICGCTEISTSSLSLDATPFAALSKCIAGYSTALSAVLGVLLSVI